MIFSRAKIHMVNYLNYYIKNASKVGISKEETFNENPENKDH